MFLNFNEIINNKKPEKDIPAIVLDYLSAELPDNLFYKSDGNGLAYISGFQKVNGLSFDTPNELKEEVGDKEISIDDFLLYSYNSQESLKLKPVKEGIVKVDNKEIAIDKFVKTINVKYKIKNGCFYIIPSPFEKKGIIKLSNNKYIKEMTFERVPYKSIKYMKFKAYSKGLYMTMLIPFSDSINASFTISYNINDLNNYKELIKCISIYDSIIKGEGKINNVILKPSTITNNADHNELLLFLNKVELVEEHLGCNFELFAGDISFGFAREIEGLYQNLIKKSPVKNYNKIESITFDDEPRIESSSDKRYVLLYKTEISKDILGVPLLLPTIVCVFNITYTCNKYKNTWKADIIYNENSYSSYLSFRSIDELNRYAESYENVVEKMSEYIDVNTLIK